MNKVTFVKTRDAEGRRRWDMKVNGMAMAYWYNEEEYEKASEYLRQKFYATRTKVDFYTETK